MSLIFICFLLKVLFPLNVELKLNFSIFLLEVNMYNIILEDGDMEVIFKIINM